MNQPQQPNLNDVLVEGYEAGITSGGVLKFLKQQIMKRDTEIFNKDAEIEKLKAKLEKKK